MDKLSMWPDLGASSSYLKNKTRMERSHSFAGALKKQTNVSNDTPASTEASTGSGSVSNIDQIETTNVQEAINNIPSNAEKAQFPPHEYEEWKQTQKLKRQAKKQEKRLLREEELRRQMVAPKGYNMQC
jgi:hypothetical protein